MYKRRTIKTKRKKKEKNGKLLKTVLHKEWKEMSRRRRENVKILVVEIRFDLSLNQN